MALLNTQYFTNIIAQVQQLVSDFNGIKSDLAAGNISQAVASQLQAEKSAALQSLASTIGATMGAQESDIVGRMDKLAPAIALLVPPTSPPQAVVWIAQNIADKLTGELQPFVNFSTQLGELQAINSQIKGAVESAASTLGTSATIPDLTATPPQPGPAIDYPQGLGPDLQAAWDTANSAMALGQAIGPSLQAAWNTANSALSRIDILANAITDQSAWDAANSALSRIDDLSDLLDTNLPIALLNSSNALVLVQSVQQDSSDLANTVATYDSQLEDAANTAINEAFAVTNLRTYVDGLVYLNSVPLTTTFVSEQNSRIDGDSALANTIGLIGAVSEDGLGFIFNTSTVYTAPGVTFADWQDTILAEANAISGGVSANTIALINTESDARVSGDEALSNSITIMGAQTNSAISNALSIITTNYTAFTVANAAIANSLITLGSEIVTANTTLQSAIANEASTRANAISTEAAARTTLASEFTSANSATWAAITNLSNTFASANSVTANALQLLGGEVGGGAAFVLNTSSVQIGGGQSLGSYITGVNASLANNTAAINTESDTRSNAIASLASSLTSLTTTVNTNNTNVFSAISTEESSRASGDTSLNNLITSLTSTVNTNNTNVFSAVASEATTRASAIAAVTTTTTDLIAGLNGTNAVVSIQGSAISTLQGQTATYISEVSSSGGTASVELLSTSGGITDVLLLAQNVSFGNGYWDETYDVLVFPSGSYQTVIGGPFGTSNTLSRWYGPTSISIPSMSSTNAISYDDIYGNSTGSTKFFDQTTDPTSTNTVGVGSTWLNPASGILYIRSSTAWLAISGELADGTVMLSFTSSPATNSAAGSSSSGTFTVPLNAPGFVTVAIGGGDGGNGFTNTFDGSGGNGGLSVFHFAVTPGSTTITWSVGANGQWSATSTGSTGGTSTCTSTGFSGTMTATGGVGGTHTAGASGTASGPSGSTNTTGGGDGYITITAHTS